MIVVGMEFRRDRTMHDEICASLYIHGDDSMGAVSLVDKPRAVELS